MPSTVEESCRSPAVAPSGAPVVELAEEVAPKVVCSHASCSAEKGGAVVGCSVTGGVPSLSVAEVAMTGEYPIE